MPPPSQVRLVRRAMDWDLLPADVLRLVRDDAHPVALAGAWAGGGAVIGSEPRLVRGPPGLLGEVLDSPLPGDGTGGAFGGGWIGYLGYGLAEELPGVPPAPGAPRLLPAWWFGYYDHVLRLDGESGRWFFEALWTPERGGELERRFGELSRRARSAAPPHDYACGGFRLVPSASEHREAVRRTVELIRRGDIFQANICLRLEAGFDGDPLDLFCRGVSRLRPPFSAFIRLPEGDVASFSPELFLRRAGQGVLSSPIKGTLRRSASAARAADQRAELERSAKNRAENVMIVDLMRNDLSRVCVPGSVGVPRLLRAEDHPGVWHLVSDVRGTLGPGRGDGDLIRAAFPPGSVTGAPKVAAMEIIAELEATPREVYTGAIGYRSPAAGLELNVAIRTFEFCGGRVWLGAGGGIVAGSLAGDEYAECLVKARPLIRAVGGRLASGRSGPADRATPGASRPSMLPRPARGVFTSLLVSSGATRDLAAHIARLDGSCAELFGKHLPPSLPGDVAACLARLPSGRLRITARPVGGQIQARVTVVPPEPDCPARALALHPVPLAGGLGAHKWLDRRLLAALAGSRPGGPDRQLLIEDGASGQVLETDRANLFAVIGGTLRTPPADGRILPGVTRAAVLDGARLAGIEVDVAPITRAQLLSASEVFVTNAVRGVVPVGEVAGRRLGVVMGPVTSLARASLAGRAAGGWTAPDGRAASPPVARTRMPGRPAKPPVLLIDNYDSFTHNLAHMLLVAGCTVEVVRNDEVTAEQVTALAPAGIVISPGPGGPADAGVSMDVVQRCGGKTPLLGVCLGHQAIAAAFGARVIGAPRPVHGQTSVIMHYGCALFTGVPERFEATRYHSLIVAEESLPPVLSVTARTSEGLPMALRHATWPLHGVQFHPESILTAHGETIVRNFVTGIGRWGTVLTSGTSARYCVHRRR